MRLQGNDALEKANKLFESMVTSPKVDSFSNVESTHLAYDGKKYGVVKENSSYVLKVSNKRMPLIAEDYDYINGVQNKLKYSKRAYNEIMKMYNLMNIEMKRLHGDTLMNEALEIDEEKHVIKVKKKSSEATPSTEIDNSSEEDLEIDSEESEEELNMDDESASENPDDYSNVDPDDLDTDDPVKKIQKLSGKLAYELRDFDDEDDYSDTAKFAMAMTISALDSDKISEEDKNDLEKKMDDKFDDTGEVESDNSDEDIEESVFLESLSNDLEMEKILLERFSEDDSIYFEMDEIPNAISKDDDELILFDEDYEQKGKKDIAVYRQRGDVTLGYEYFHKVFLRDPMYQHKDPVMYVEYDSERTDETPFILHVNGIKEKFQYVNGIYPVDEDPKVNNNIEEEVYTDTPKRPRNKKFITAIGDLEVGRYYGDDDAVSDIDVSESDKSEKFDFGKIYKTKQEPRNPFKYKG